MKINNKNLLLFISGLIILLIIILRFSPKNNFAKEYCLINGYKYEERLFNGVARSYCVFNNSECLAESYFNGSCKPGDDEFFYCTNFSGVKYCSQELMPVCAKVRIGIKAPFTFISEEWGNACSACFNSKESRKVIYYLNHSC